MTIKEDGTVYLDMLVIQRDELAAALERMLASAASRTVGVRADKDFDQSGYTVACTLGDTCGV